MVKKNLSQEPRHSRLFERSNLGAREMAQWFRALRAVLTEDPDSIPFSHIQQLTITYNSRSKGSSTPFWSPCVPIYMWYTYRQASTHTHTHKIEISKNLRRSNPGCRVSFFCYQGQPCLLWKVVLQCCGSCLTCHLIPIPTRGLLEIT